MHNNSSHMRKLLTRKTDFFLFRSLNGNPLHCNNCELFWFVDFLLNSNRNRDVQITGVCTEPASLHDKPLNYLGVATETQGCSKFNEN